VIPTLDEPGPLDTDFAFGIAPDSRGAVWLSGEGTLDFLHRMTTANLREFAPGEVRPTLLLTESGRAVDLLWIYPAPEGCLVITTTHPAARVVADRLRSHVLYGDHILVTDATDQVAVASVWPAAASSIGDTLRSAALSASAVVSDPRPSTASSAPSAWTRVPWHSDELWRLAEPGPERQGVELLVVPRPHGAALAAAFHAAGFPPCDPDSIRVQHGAPAFGAEMGVADAGNPHELGLTGLVDTAKGCYVGQEVVARLVTYDKVQRALAIVRVSGGCASGDLVALSRIVGGRPGRLTTLAAEPEGLALAFVPKAARSGDHLRITRDGAETGDGIVLRLVPAS
jgi:folate-binding protein YgfZ